MRARGLIALLVLSNGNRVSETQATDVTTPLELGLEFVDATGRVLWTAPSQRP
jgi:hypothetical protein